MNPGIRNFTYSFDELGLNMELIEEAMGYEKGQSPEPFPDMISIALSQSVDLANIKGSLRVSDHFLLDRSGYIEIDSVTFGVGKKIARQLKNAEGGVLFICTAGPGIGEKSKELMSAGDLMEGYILDVIGSLTVDAAIDKIQTSLEDEFLKEGKKIANRYSPGYCGWALSEQKLFFDLFPDNYCGIELTESCLMDPVKSVSGIIGFGEGVRKTAYECDLCELKTCTYRKLRLAKLK